jgi:putative SOS response-associated peptidase YedK
MCGRYNVTDNPVLHALLEEFGIDVGPLPERYNIAPTEQVPVVAEIDGQYVLRDMRWWLVPHWSDGPSSRYAMFNARSENLGKSPAFRGPFRRQRCVLPATSFIEWQTLAGKKQPYLIEPQQQPLLFAGIWDCWEGLYSCSIVTTAASDAFAEIHSRQPVLLDRVSCHDWLQSGTAEKALLALCEPSMLPVLQVTAVDALCNNARNKERPVLIASERIIH